ncbi:MAG: M43 family zinc metalloprotease, partial [Cytophagales bacterium]|nr:M43 family zinc metalloprotease [Cytophagales bacterium]
MTGNRAFRLVIIILATALPAVCLFAQEHPHRCATAHYDSLRQAQNPAYRASRQRLEELIRRRQENAGLLRAARLQQEPVIIPVVVHVIHNNPNGTIGGANNTNISDAQIQAQIDVLNLDYRRRNADTLNAPPEVRALGTDIEIGFQLASRDPNGLPTNGITRTLGTQSSYSPDDMDVLADISGWPPDRYLNIWVTTMSGQFIGYAQLPDGTGLPGLDPVNGAENSDGIMVDYRNFGIGGAVSSRLYNRGRTTTHEVGHWLGLLHTWGDRRCGTDYVADTPTAEDANEVDNNDCAPVFSNCTGTRTRNMTENYMDYSPDVCMNLFTRGQYDRIWSTLALSPRRRRLLESLRRQLPESEQLTVNVFPNPFTPQVAAADPSLKVEVLLKGLQDVTIDIIDLQGKLVVSRRYPLVASSVLGVPLGTMNTLAKGVYIVRISTASETQMRR